MAEEYSSSSKMVPGGLLVVEGCPPWVRVQGEAEGHLVEGAEEVEEACHHQEEEVGGTCLQMMVASVEEAEGCQGVLGEEEDLQERQLLPVSAGTD